MEDSREHNSAGFLQPRARGHPHSPSATGLLCAQRCPGPFPRVFAQALRASQTTASRKAGNHEQPQQLDVMTTETSELTFANQPDKFFVKPKQSSASRKSFRTDFVLPICKSHAVLRTSLKDVFANFNITIKVYIILGQVLCRQPGFKITSY